MQRIVIVLCILFFLPHPALHSQPKVVIVGGLSFDFGEINSSMTAKRIITIRNEGNDTLTIQNVSGSCGCTGTLLSNDHIIPGDSGTLAISFDPRKFSGHVEKAVSMDTNDPKNPRPHITFTATVEKTLTIEPEYVVFHAGTNIPAKETLTITNTSSQALRILSITSSSSLLSFESFKQELEPGKSAEITCIFTSLKQGTEKGDISITTSDQKLPVITLRFFALVKSAQSDSNR
jgi:hypothetical protein